MSGDIQVREAAWDDSREIWEWWNDPVTRKMMRKNDYVPWEEHGEWFAGVLQDQNRILCIGTRGQEKLGVVRFDQRNEFEYEVSINLNPAYRGNGLGRIILREAISYLLGVRKVKKLWAGCKKVNVPSRKTFEGVGFSFKPHAAYEPLGELYCERIVGA